MISYTQAYLSDAVLLFSDVLPTLPWAFTAKCTVISKIKKVDVRPPVPHVHLLHGRCQLWHHSLKKGKFMLKV